MTTRDRLVLIGISTLALLAAVWFLFVSPERKEAAKLATQVSAATAKLNTAESSVAAAHTAQERYSDAYASIVSLGKAVPASEELPSLMYQLAEASDQKNVEFNSITAGGSSNGAAPAASTATAATTPVGFTQMPFTFIFSGTFSDLSHLFTSLNGSTVRTTSGGLQVSGRLLTLQAVKLENTAAAGSETSSEKLTGTITATAYVLPAGQGLTAGATPAAPTSSAATTASAPSSSSPSAPAPVATIGAR